MVKVSACTAVAVVEVALTARLGPAGTAHSSVPCVPSSAAKSSVSLRLVRLPGYELLGRVAP
jgi:hypothetical protein